MYFSDKCNHDQRTLLGETALLLAVQQLSTFENLDNLHSVIRTLIDHPVHVSLFDEAENSPLHAATKAGDKIVVDMLIKSGARINAGNIFEEIPLHLAVKLSDTGSEIAKKLVDKQSNLWTMNYNYETPFHAAIIAKNIDAAILKVQFAFNFTGR